MNEKIDAKYRVGLIGLWAQRNRDMRGGYRFHPLTEVVAAADTDAENLGAFPVNALMFRGYADYEEMLEKERIDIAAPILPTSVNPEVVLRCARLPASKRFSVRNRCPPAWKTRTRMVEACRSRGIKFAGLATRFGICRSIGRRGR